MPSNWNALSLPKESFPVVGRSIVYRFGAFHALAQASLLHLLPKEITPAQVRCALTAVIQRQLKSPSNFDAKGWIRVGFTGSQMKISESYINNGSAYLCSVGLLALGLLQLILSGVILIPNGPT